MLVQKEVKNAYIWEYVTLPIPTNWLLGYRPLEADNKDLSGNNYDVTITGCSFGTIGDKSWIRISTSYTNSPTDYITTPNIWNPTTFSFCWWLYKTTTATSGSSDWTSFFDNATSDTGDALRWRCKYNYVRPHAYWNAPSDANSYTITPNSWTHYVLTSDGSTAKVYANWQYYNSFTAWTTSSGSTWVYYIGRGAGSGLYRNRPWWVRHFALYNRVLTDQEVSSIYTATA